MHSNQHIRSMRKKNLVVLYCLFFHDSYLNCFISIYIYQPFQIVEFDVLAHYKVLNLCSRHVRSCRRRIHVSRPQPGSVIHLRDIQPPPHPGYSMKPTSSIIIKHCTNTEGLILKKNNSLKIINAIWMNLYLSYHIVKNFNTFRTLNCVFNVKNSTLFPFITALLQYKRQTLFFQGCIFLKKIPPPLLRFFSAQKLYTLAMI